MIVNRELVEKALASRVRGRAALATTAVRIVTGVFFISVSISKFTEHSKEVADFKRYGVPIPEVAVYVVGTIELIGGIALTLGLLTRLAALLLAADMIGAISTAGRVEGGGFNLGVAPTMLAAMLFLLWAGPGLLALDHRLLTRLSSAAT
jgi:putative oxidoreductase